MAKKKELKKHSSAIHTDGKLSLLERKLSNVMLYNAYDDLLTKRIHEIPVGILSEISGFNSNDTNTLKKSIENLNKVIIGWDILEEDGTAAWGRSTLLAGVEIRDGVCRYEYSQLLSEKLSEPQYYGIINLEIQKNFTSGYSLTIYEICARFKGLLSKREECFTVWYTLEEFKKFLGVEDSEYYKDFKQFNAKILKPSINEINGSLKKFAGTDIHIEAEYKRKNRSISDIRFRITRNAQTPLPLENSQADDIRKSPQYAQLIERGMQDGGARHAIQTRDSETLAANIKAVDNMIAQKKVKTSVGGLMQASIDGNYKPAQKQTTKQIEKEYNEAKAKEQKGAIEDLRRKGTKQIRTEYINSLTIAEQETLFDELKAEQPPSMKKHIKTINSPQIAAAINKRIPDFEMRLKAFVEGEAA